MEKINNKKWIFGFISSIILIFIQFGCITDNKNVMSFTDKTVQCSIDKTNSKKNRCKPDPSCLYLPYYNDRVKTKELLTFIIHGQKNVNIINQDFNHIKIIVKSTNLPINHTINIFFDDNNNSVFLCPGETKDWFSIANRFTKKIQSNYLSIADKG